MKAGFFAEGQGRGERIGEYTSLSRVERCPPKWTKYSYHPMPALWCWPAHARLEYTAYYSRGRTKKPKNGTSVSDGAKPLRLRGELIFLHSG